MHTARTARGGWRRAVATAGALAIAMSTMLATTAAADTTSEVTDGELEWGFREAFRNYVGRQTAALPSPPAPVPALPVGERITLIGSAQWDAAGTPAWAESPSEPNETLPYLFEVTGGEVVSADDLVLETTGGAAYHFPNHAFEIFLENVAIVVEDGVGTIRGDLAVIVPENLIGVEPGEFGGEDVPLGAIENLDVVLGEDSVTVTGTGVTLSEEGAEALQDFLPVDSPLDDFTVTAAIQPVDGGGNGEEPVEYDPTDYDLGEAQWAISGYLSASSPGRPNPSPANYVAPAAFDADTRISSWGDGSGTLDADGTAELAFAGTSVNHATTGGGWLRIADLEATLDASGNGTVSAVVSYGTAVPPANYDPEQAPVRGPERIDVVALQGNDAAPVQDDDTATWTGLAGLWHDDLLAFLAGDGEDIAAWLYASTITNNPDQPDRQPTPLTFSLEVDTTPSEPGDDEGEQDIIVTVPEDDEEPEPGIFAWAIDNSGGAASLGTAAVNGDHLLATGAINPITVTDTRLGGLTWSISAQVSDFTAGDDSFEGRYLGWTPQVVVEGAGATAGDPVASGFAGGDGLGVARELASASAGHELGSAELGAGLELRLPLDTAPGDYGATLTVTALS